MHTVGLVESLALLASKPILNDTIFGKVGEIWNAHIYTKQSIVLTQYYLKNPKNFKYYFQGYEPFTGHLYAAIALLQGWTF